MNNKDLNGKNRMSNSEKYVCTNVPLQIKKGAYLKWHQMIKNMLFCVYNDSKHNMHYTNHGRHCCLIEDLTYSLLCAQDTEQHFFFFFLGFNVSKKQSERIILTFITSGNILHFTV